MSHEPPDPFQDPEYAEWFGTAVEVLHPRNDAGDGFTLEDLVRGLRPTD